MEEILKDDRHLLQLRFVVARLDDANFGDPRRLAEVKAVEGIGRRERECRIQATRCRAQTSERKSGFKL